jgi:hypothetical protein
VRAAVSPTPPSSRRTRSFRKRRRLSKNNRGKPRFRFVSAPEANPIVRAHNFRLPSTRAPFVQPHQPVPESAWGHGRASRRRSRHVSCTPDSRLSCCAAELFSLVPEAVKSGSISGLFGPSAPTPAVCSIRETHRRGWEDWQRPFPVKYCASCPCLGHSRVRADCRQRRGMVRGAAHVGPSVSRLNPRACPDSRRSRIRPICPC